MRRSRRRSAALRDAAGVYHVASRLSYEGFRATVAQRPGATGADALASLPGAPATAALSVRTTTCPPGFGGGGDACEWRVGKGAALADDPGLFVALVDFGRAGRLPGVWVVPSATMRGHFVSPEEGRPWRYRASAGELAPYKDGWDAVEDHLLGGRPSQRGWIIREELEERYGEEFVAVLDAEMRRLLGAHNSTIRKMADERFGAEELAEASALLSVLFRRWMEAERERRRQERSGRLGLSMPRHAIEETTAVTSTGLSLLGIVRAPLQLREHVRQGGPQRPCQLVGCDDGGSSLRPLDGAHIIAVHATQLGQPFLG